ncbi:hypothetical protein E0Z10_g1855 [Xylaria hypoxylon]|uniref:Diterpenoid pyrone biosynthesis cluster protein C n=1 Tax=Xylaria hypoxylon TaxID=37992 RepID=A0A4Z0YS79_9PEZI|nr:hypothetical protein E0Z10_g1855 [Xylaria hypoxylon]
MSVKAGKKASSPIPQRNTLRGVWELARFHTRESWLCWYPSIWGACIAASSQNVVLDPYAFLKVIFGIWVSVTVSHAAFCTFNDICDQNLDVHVERCKTRPLPSGMISNRNAVLAFLLWMPVTVWVTNATLGDKAVIAFVPIWILSFVYPFMKRLIPFPQVVLGATIGAAVFPGWVAITQRLDDVGEAVPLFWATAVWVVYFDVIYATQDSPDDEKIGVKSLAIFMAKHMTTFLSVLAILQVALFAQAARQAHSSLIFWIFGVCVWALNMPWHLLSLDISDRKSGGRVFKANIKLGLYMTGVSIAELIVNRVRLS